MKHIIWVSVFLIYSIVALQIPNAEQTKESPLNAVVSLDETSVKEIE